MEKKDKQIMEFTVVGLKLGQEANKKMKEIYLIEKRMKEIEHEIEHIINAGPIEDMKSPQELLDAVHSLHLNEYQTNRLYELLFKHATMVEVYYRLSDELKKLSDKIHAASFMVKAMNDI